MPLVKLKSGVIRQYSDRDAKLLVLVKKGEIVADEPKEPPKETATQATEPSKRAYRRKDMQAEGK